MPDWSRYVHDHLPPLRVSPERENEITRELALQLEQTYAEAIASGLSDQQARTRAEAQFGDWRRLGRAIDDAERPIPVEPDPAMRRGLFIGILYDVRHAFRFLRRSPLIATLAILTLAFGIGANTAI